MMMMMMMMMMMIFFLQFTGKIVAKSVIDLFLSWTVRFPKMFVLWFGPFDARVLLNHPETIKKVLKTAGRKCIAAIN